MFIHIEHKTYLYPILEASVLTAKQVVNSTLMHKLVRGTTGMPLGLLPGHPNTVLCLKPGSWSRDKTLWSPVAEDLPGLARVALVLLPHTH